MVQKASFGGKWIQALVLGVGVVEILSYPERKECCTRKKEQHFEFERLVGKSLNFAQISFWSLSFEMKVGSLKV